MFEQFLPVSCAPPSVSPGMWVESAHTPAFVKAELGGGSRCVFPPSELRESDVFLKLLFTNPLNLHLPLGIKCFLSDKPGLHTQCCCFWVLYFDFFFLFSLFLNCKFHGLQLMFTFEQQIKAGLIRCVLYPKIIKETFEVSERSQLLYNIGNSCEKVRSVFRMV